MKVLALVDSDTYLVEVSHSEIEKVFDKYYGKLDKLKVGAKIDLSEGYEFRTDIKAACRAMQEAMEKFDLKRETLFQFAELIAKQKDGA